METTKEAMVEFVSLKSLRTCGTDGANMEDARGVIKVISERRPPTTHFFFVVQFSGFKGSS